MLTITLFWQLFSFFYPDNHHSLSERSIASTFYSFPNQFKWCTATAAHQIEGNNNHSDWWEWEHTPGKIKNGDQSKMATNHWNMIPDDIKLMKELGLNQYRFSIEWAKVEPLEGQIDQSVLDHYEYEINSLLAEGIDPMITLHHFTSPLWFSQKGGWGNPKAYESFVRFSKIIIKRFQSKVSTWITFNEPMVFISAGFLAGVFPPGIKDIQQTVTPIKNVLLANAEIYHYAHSLNPKVKVGMAHHMRVMEPKNKLNPLDHYFSNIMAQVFNWTLLETIKTGILKIYIPTQIKFKEKMPQVTNTQDFIGLNYYSRDLVSFSPFSKEKIKISFEENSPHNDLGWEIYPEGMLKILTEIHQRFPRHTIHITENGIADQTMNDQKRIKYINDHLFMVHQALKQGIEVTGYCYWSLMDNFEWAEGYFPRFGLYQVDYSHFSRNKRASVHYFQSTVFKNGIEYPMNFSSKK